MRLSDDSGQHAWLRACRVGFLGAVLLFDVDHNRGLSSSRHRWLHCMTDDPPTKKPPTARKFIWANHKFNVTGTPEQYVPYSTTRKKIQEWVPPSTPYK
ncbi:NADH dehydrogenase [ubiquinone] 1 alpha subcomplex subunit 12 [Microtus ochrogaster]|uniref:NADH dehydrogenase [ubiquinone] 1 alpha subcomplex subunit 12 n=1 Tax=Microtus ochrogaster TaxID=79684 RepID=A0A8J6G7U0_MICOH|nr:NADH dehydrogenase [ubiquinone] 1 alpha subcomplex subunit 12 [Microtus ochrogaster]